jgi:hypothetical protein
MSDGLIKNLPVLYSKLSSVIILWSGILVYLLLVDFNTSLIELLSESLRVQIFSVLVGLVIGIGLSELNSEDLSRSQIDENISIYLGVSLFTIVFFGLLTLVNTEIASFILIYSGLWHGIITYKTKDGRLER